MDLKKEPREVFPDVLPASRVEHSSTETYNIVRSSGGRIYAHVRLLVIVKWEGGPDHTKRKGHIEDLWVHPHFRGRGFSRSLMEDAHKEARKHGCPRTYLTCRPGKERKRARVLYKDLGYEETAGRFVLDLTKEETNKKEKAE